MKDLLFLAHRLPYPPDKGDKIRSYQLLRHLGRRYRIHLGTFVDDPADRRHVPAVEAMCASSWIGDLRSLPAKLRGLGRLAAGGSLSFGYFFDRGLAAWVASVRAAHDPVVELACSSPMVAYLAGGRPGVRRIADLVDLDSEKWRQYATHHGPPMRWLYALESGRLGAEEVALSRRVDAALLCTGREADDLRARPGVPAARVAVVGNGVDLDYFAPGAGEGAAGPPPGPGPLLVFTGMMDYWANVEGISWFADAVLPKLQAARPGLRLAVVGARPTAAVRRLALRPGIIVTGRVPDVRPWLARADLAVVPLRIARGVQNKVLEAMAMGLAVVATPAAAQGIEALPGRDLAVAGDEEAFAGTVLELLADDARRRELGARARLLVEERYGWAARLAALDRLLAAGRPQEPEAIAA